MRTLQKSALALAGMAMLSAAMVSGAAAAEGSVNVGQNFTEVSVGLGQESTGLYVDGNWAKNTTNGREKAGAEAGINLSAGPAQVNLGAQANYVKGNSGLSEGVVFPVGAGVKLPLVSDVALYSSIYTAPRQLSNTAKSYLDVDAGLSWAPVSMVTLKAGYRYIGMDGKNQRDNQRLIEGPYLGGQLSF